MQDIVPPSRDKAPVPTGRARKRRSGLIVFGVTSALGLGLAGGLYLHRFVDLDLAAARVREHVASSLSWAGREIGARVERFTKSPVTVAQASSPTPTEGPQPASSGDINDLSGRVDQARVANETSARDLIERLERLRIAADQNRREVMANLTQLGERLERIERTAKAGTAAVVVPRRTQPVVQSPSLPPARPSIRATAKSLRTPIPEAKAKVKPRQPLLDSNSGQDDNRIPNWAVLEVLDGTAVLSGPQGLVEVSPGDSIPGIGRVQAIVRSGRRWIVATSKGVITAQ